MANYFRIVGYHPEDDFCFIADSNGKFDMIWQFSSCLVKKGIKVLEISGEDKFLDVNFSRAEENDKQIIKNSLHHLGEILSFLISLYIIMKYN